MAREKKNAWQNFTGNPNPLAKFRELKAAIPDGPGLAALYEEAKAKGTVLGVPVLTVGRNLYIPRARMVERIERGE